MATTTRRGTCDCCGHEGYTIKHELFGGGELCARCYEWMPVEANCVDCGATIFTCDADPVSRCEECREQEQAAIQAELHAERDWLDACARERAAREAEPDTVDADLNDGVPF